MIWVGWKCEDEYYYYYYYFTALWILSRTTQVSWHQKGKTKTNVDFLEQGIVSGNGISWAICKSALADNHAGTHHEN